MTFVLPCCHRLIAPIGNTNPGSSLFGTPQTGLGRGGGLTGGLGMNTAGGGVGLFGRQQTGGMFGGGGLFGQTPASSQAGTIFGGGGLAGGVTGGGGLFQTPQCE